MNTARCGAWYKWCNLLTVRKARICPLLFIRRHAHPETLFHYNFINILPRTWSNCLCGILSGGSRKDTFKTHPGKKWMYLHRGCVPYFLISLNRWSRGIRRCASTYARSLDWFSSPPRMLNLPEWLNKKISFIPCEVSNIFSMGRLKNPGFSVSC